MLTSRAFAPCGSAGVDVIARPYSNGWGATKTERDERLYAPRMGSDQLALSAGGVRTPGVAPAR